MPGGIRTQDCRTAARRANHIATPHLLGIMTVISPYILSLEYLLTCNFSLHVFFGIMTCNFSLNAFFGVLTCNFSLHVFF